MRINLHQHTLKVKNSENPTRNLDIKSDEDVERFFSNLVKYEVGVLAITNHNFFDKEQFDFLHKISKEKGILLLPGIEIDIIDDFEQSTNFLNLGIIVSDEDKDRWWSLINELVPNKKIANSYKIKLSELIGKLSDFKKIYLIPNKQKGGKDLSQESLDLILQDKNSERFFETTNFISTKILNLKGIPSIYGSDECKDILQPKYENLPNPRIKIDSFENLKLFLKKDPHFISPQLKEKFIQEFSIKPKPENSEEWKNELKIPIYRDVNVIIGPKATGKSIILEELMKKIKAEEKVVLQYYDPKNGVNDYGEHEEKIKKRFDIPSLFNEDVKILDKFLDNNHLGGLAFANILKNFNDIIKWSRKCGTSKYKSWIEFQYSNEMKVFVSEEINIEKEFKELKKVLENIKQITKKIDEYRRSKNNFENLNNHDTVKNYLQKMQKFELEEYTKTFTNKHTYLVIGKIVSKISDKISALTAHHKKPNEIGMYSVFLARNQLFGAVKKIFCWEKIVLTLAIGRVSNLKQFYLIREYFSPDIEGLKKGSAKNLGESLNWTTFKGLKKEGLKIIDDIWSESLLSHLVQFSEILKNNAIKKLENRDFIWYEEYTVDQNKRKVVPSSGEKSIISLMNYLDLDQKYYVLDEPEQSLDGFFVNETIVSRINNLAKLNKAVIIVTHNPNIAIRTYPYSIIYRDNSQIYSQDQDQERETYFGNAFLKDMQDSNGKLAKDKLNQICQKILEGGKEAFHERAHRYSSE